MDSRILSRAECRRSIRDNNWEYKGGCHVDGA